MTKYGDVYIEGLDELKKKLYKAEDNYAAPWRKVMSTVERYGRTVIRGYAPRKSGATANAVSSEMDQSHVPEWVLYHLDSPTDDKGFRYAGALHGARAFTRSYRRRKAIYFMGARLSEYEGNVNKTVQYKYRSSGPIGKPTYHWFTKGIPKIRRTLNSLMDKAKGEIEQLWAK